MVNMEKVNNWIESSINRLTEAHCIFNNLSLTYAKDGNIEMSQKYKELSENMILAICTLARQKERDRF